MRRGGYEVVSAMHGVMLGVYDLMGVSVNLSPLGLSLSAGLLVQTQLFVGDNAVNQSSSQAHSALT